LSPYSGRGKLEREGNLQIAAHRKKSRVKKRGMENRCPRSSPEGTLASKKKKKHSRKKKRDFSNGEGGTVEFQGENMGPWEHPREYKGQLMASKGRGVAMREKDHYRGG